VSPTRSRSRPSYILAVLVLAAVTLITLDVRGHGSATLRHGRDHAHDLLSSVQSAVHDGLRPIGNFLTGAADYGSLRAENTALRQEVAASRLAQDQAVYDRIQADQVLQLSQIPFAADYRTVVADVTGQSSSNFDEAVTIGKGASSGIAVGEPVLTSSGLAGQVSGVSAGTATITLITNPQLIVGVGLPGGNIGSAQSLGPGEGLDVSVIATSKPPPDLKPGAVLYTSAVGRAFPPGLPVATVSSVVRAAGSPEPTVTARPLAATANLSYVSIMLWLPQ
jgi:rod shape-determining protein MreC